MSLRELLEIASHVVFPRSCPLCGAPGRFVCPECLIAAYAVGEPQTRCLRCGGPLPCPQHGRAFEMRALCLHHGAARDLILAAKYGGKRGLARRLGEELAPLAPVAGDWTISFVPERRRPVFLPDGGGHLEWMARGLSHRTGYRVRPLLKWAMRVKSQKEQPSADARRAMPRGCFACATGDIPERVILLDDVSTTGTTLERAASCLYAGGAREVVCLCWSVP